MPSRVASSRASRSASLPFTGTISSISPSATAVSVRRRDEVGAPALHQVGAEQRMAGARRAIGSARLARCRCRAPASCRARPQHADARIGGLEATRHAQQRAAGAETGDEGVDPLAREVSQDLLRRRARVHLGIGLVVELAAQEPAVLVGQFDRLVQHAGALLGRRREHHPGAEKAQQPAPLHAEVLGHRQHQRIALVRAHHRQADAGIAAGRLDHGLAGGSAPRAFGMFDDGAGHAVLDRTQRVERLELDVDVDTRRVQAC